MHFYILTYNFIDSIKWNHEQNLALFKLKITKTKNLGKLVTLKVSPDKVFFHQNRTKIQNVWHQFWAFLLILPRLINNLKLSSTTEPSQSTRGMMSKLNKNSVCSNTLIFLSLSSEKKPRNRNSINEEKHITLVGKIVHIWGHRIWSRGQTINRTEFDFNPMEQKNQPPIYTSAIIAYESLSKKRERKRHQLCTQENSEQKFWMWVVTVPAIVSSDRFSV